ncbi:MAG: hypothetical protein ACP5I1_10975 [Candidatus Hinthialibacter sp.]
MISFDRLNQWGEWWASFMFYQTLDSIVIFLVVGILWLSLRPKNGGPIWVLSLFTGADQSRHSQPIFNGWRLLSFYANKFVEINHFFPFPELAPRTPGDR